MDRREDKDKKAFRCTVGTEFHQVHAAEVFSTRGVCLTQMCQIRGRRRRE